MAKIRRVVRKVESPGHGDVFDEQMWPTYVALIVLGGFLMGVSAAYLKWQNAPWYAHAATSLVAIPLVIGGFMIAFRYIDNRVVRRSMQFSIVVCAIIHLALIVHMLETHLFSGQREKLATDAQLIETRPPKVIPEYQPQQLMPEEDRPRQDHEKPVETETPEPEQTQPEVKQQPTERETTPPAPQPVPVPEQTPTAQPNVVKRPETNETAPRQAEQSSKLSRQQTPSTMKISQTVDAPQQAAQKTPAADTKPAEALVQRQTTAADTPRRAPEREPTTTADSATPQVARQTPQHAPVPETTAQPTLRRQMNQPQATPRTQIAAADAPAAAKQTTAEPLAARNTTTQKQVTASPQSTAPPKEPVPEVSTNAAAQPQRRQSEAEVQPTVAQTPAPVANRQPKTTNRPEVATTASKVAPTDSSTPSPSATTELAPQATTQVAKAAASVTAPKATQLPSAEPNTAYQNQPAARIARSQATQNNPTAQANPAAAPTRTRQSGAPSIAATARADATAAAATTSAAGEQLSAQSTATRKQEVAAAQVSPTTGAPSAAQTASQSTATSSPSLVRKSSTSQQSGDAPSVAQANSSSPATGRSATATGQPNVTTTAANVQTNSGPTTSANPQPGAASALVSRQPSNSSPTANRTQPSAEAPSATATTQLAAGGVARAQASSVPTINPTAPATNSPSRSLSTAAVAASPAAVDSPAIRAAEQGAGDPAAAPARLAINKGLAGVAGSGQSPNLDTSFAGGESPAMVASAAARRTQATQDGPKGDALSPSAPATVGRSRAQADAPSATLTAVEADYATTGGAAQTAEVTASASAAIARASANAPAGSVSAAKGTTEVDLGPTMIVADTGSGSRAAGGGQPTINADTRSPQLARSASAGGAPQVALATDKVAAEAVAPAGEGGGQPTNSDPGPTATAAARTTAGGEATLAGGPSAAAEKGPLAEVDTASLLAEQSVSRADTSEGAAGSAAGGGQPSLEDEEEKQRRLARAAAGGAPQLALAAAQVADVPTSPAGEAGDGGGPRANVEAAATAISSARANNDGGAPRGGAAADLAEAATASEAGGGQVVSAQTIARAEASSGAPGSAPELGGGTASAARSATGPTFAANATAATVELAGAPQSGGQTNGQPLEAQGIEAGRLSGGAQGALVSGPVGAAAGEAVVEASSAGPSGPASGKRLVSPSGEAGPEVGDVANVGAPGKRAATTAAAAGGDTTVEVPQVGAGSAIAQAELDHVMGGMGAGTMTKQAGDALAVSVEAPEGPGGLGTEITPQVGLNTRQARADSLDVQTRTARFVRQKVGGLPSISTVAVASTDSFRARTARKMGEQPAGGKGSPPPQTEDAIESGLRFLARYQTPDGSWSLQGFGEEAALRSDTGATALALLSFQGAGYNHREHQYKDVVRSGLDFLVKSQKENGDLFIPLDDESNRSVWLYSHALATLALCEAYGMTQDPALREPAQKAIDFIVAAQHKERGGWRYSPGIGSDTSVTGWMMMALKSGELATLDVPKDAYAKIAAWLNASQAGAGEPHLYRYNPYAPDTIEQRHGRVPSNTMTSVGLLMRLYSGWKRDNPNMVAGAEHLRRNLPQLGTPRQPARDTYYWYYATQVMFHMGGDYWAEWNGQLHPMLIQSQLKDGPLAGSWNPRGPVPDRWGLHAGRLYVTTMNLLSLEVYYRHLPLYDDTAK